jgi:hypothetical protein
MLRAFVVLACILLTSATAHASGRSLAAESSGLRAAWEWVAEWLHSVPGLSAIWGEEGGMMDPNG